MLEILDSMLMCDESSTRFDAEGMWSLVEEFDMEFDSRVTAQERNRIPDPLKLIQQP